MLGKYCKEVIFQQCLEAKFSTDFIMCEILSSLDPNASIGPEKMWRRIQRLDFILIQNADLFIYFEKYALFHVLS